MRFSTRSAWLSSFAVAVLLAGCSLTEPEEPVALDLSGDWEMVAQHQEEPELHIYYRFSVDGNVTQDLIVVEAEQKLLETSLWVRQISGSIEISDNNIRLEFSFPESITGPEVATASFRRIIDSSSLVIMDVDHYEGQSIGIGNPGGRGPTGYDTSNVTLDQLTQ